MTDDKETLLIVGGAHAGQEVTVFKGESTIRLLIPQPASEMADASAHPEETSPIEARTYNRSKWRSGDTPLRDWHFFKPFDWTDGQVMDELVANYRPKPA